MTSNPWDKFFWNDWENDPALKLCGLAAQGLWMRILCICAKADPKGYLVVAGRPLSAADLAALAGKPQLEVETLLRELATYGVSSTDRIGRIYSRRMTRDVKKSRTARENGGKGGNPSLSKGTVIPASDNHSVKPPDKPQKPEARNHEEVSSLRSDTYAAASPPAPVLGPEFIRLPTNRFELQGEEFPVYDKFAEEMQALYPAIDVRDQLRAMRAWLLTHDRQRKTKSGMKRFINSWLSRSQNSAPRETLRGNGNGHGRRQGPSANDKFLAAAAAVVGDFLGSSEGGDDSGPANEIGRPLLSA